MIRAYRVVSMHEGDQPVNTVHHISVLINMIMSHYHEYLFIVLIKPNHNSLSRAARISACLTGTAYL